MKTIFLNLHSSNIAGPIDYFKDYLLKNNYQVFYLSHPLDNYKNCNTLFYDNNKLVKKIRRFNFGLFNLLLDFFISLRCLLVRDVDIFVGANNFDTLPAILARKVFFKKINKIIYFPADFSENRFKSNLLNKIYYWIERIAIKYSDFVISNTKRAESKRFEFGLNDRKSLIIPNGVFLVDSSFKNKKIDKSSFIYVGSVSKEHGLYNFLNVIKPIIKKFVLIGDGSEWDVIINFLKKENIVFESHQRKSHDFVIDYLQKFNGIGLAPYNNESKWTYYCSPLKVNEYVACGVPVIISSMPEISDYLTKNCLGIVYDKLNFEELSDKIKRFNVDNYSQKASQFYELYNYDTLYDKINLTI